MTSQKKTAKAKTPKKRIAKPNFVVSRLWSNPPMDANGDLDYSRLNVAEIHEDVVEELSDLVYNAGKVHLNPLRLSLCATKVWNRVRTDATQAPEELVALMHQFRRLLEHDTYLKTPEATALLSTIADFFENLTRRA